MEQPTFSKFTEHVLFFFAPPHNFSFMLSKFTGNTTSTETPPPPVDICQISTLLAHSLLKERFRVLR